GRRCRTLRELWWCGPPGPQPAPWTASAEAQEKERREDQNFVGNRIGPVALGHNPPRSPCRYRPPKNESSRAEERGLAADDRPHLRQEGGVYLLPQSVAAGDGDRPGSREGVPRGRARRPRADAGLRRLPERAAGAVPPRR